MSTSAINEALEHLRKIGEVAQSERISKLVADAQLQVRGIERACVAVVQEKALEDWSSAQPAELAEGIRLLQGIARGASK